MLVFATRYFANILLEGLFKRRMAGQ